MLPVFLIDVTPPQQDADLVATMVAACSRAVSKARCMIQKPARDTTIIGRAKVRFHGSSEATISADEQPPQHLSFPAHEPQREVWRAVGFALGGLAAGAASRLSEGSSDAAKKDAVKQGPEPDLLDRSTTPQRSDLSSRDSTQTPPESPESNQPPSGWAPRLWLGIEGYLAPPTGPGALRGGPGIRFGVEPDGLLRFAASSDYLVERTDQLALSWWTSGVLGGVGSSLGAVDFEALVGLHAQLFSATATDSETGFQQARNRWAGVLSAEGWLGHFRDRFGGGCQVRYDHSLGPTQVNLRTEPIAEAPRNVLRFSCGLRLAL